MKKINNILNLIHFLEHYNISNVICCSKKIDLKQFSNFDIKLINDERSAAYYACGVAEELNKPVVLIVDDSIASRNIAPGLTEAFYKQLPILVIKVNDCGLEDISHMNDILKSLYKLDDIKDELSLYNNILKMKKIFLDLLTNGSGPVQVNININDNYYETNTNIAIPSYYYKSLNTKLTGTSVIVLPSTFNCDENLNKNLIDLSNESNIVVMAQTHNNFRGNYIHYDLDLLSRFDNIFFINEVPSNYDKSNNTIILTENLHHIDLNKVDMIYNFNIFLFIKLIHKLNIKYERINIESNINKTSIDDLVSKIIELENKSSTIITNGKLSVILPNNVKHILNDDHKFSVSIAIGAAMVSTNKNVYVILDYNDALQDINAFGNRCITNNIKMIILNAKNDLDDYLRNLGYILVNNIENLCKNNNKSVMLIK